MKSIIPFEKEIVFKRNVSEITSISLEHEINIDGNLVSGNFIISGDYKISDSSKTVEKFDLKIPLEINLDEKFDTEKAEVDIDDFYYEIINNSILKVCIDVLIDKLEEKEVKEEDLIDMDRNINIIDEVSEKVEEVKEKIVDKVKDIGENITNKITDKVTEDIADKVVDKTDEQTKKIKSLFTNMDSSDIYVSYNIYIIREGDTVETILNKYDITDEELKKYNDLSDLKIGDKIVIPNN